MWIVNLKLTFYFNEEFRQNVVGWVKWSGEKIGVKDL